MKLSDQKMNIPAQAAGTAAAILMLVVAMPQQAHATKKLYTPYVEAGELELEYRARYEIDDDNDVDGKWVQKVAAGYGVNDYWFTEIYGEFEKEGESGADAEFAAIEWENKFQLTQPGEYWADFGFLVEGVYNTSGGADKVEAMGLIAKDTGQFSHAVNLIVEREFGEDSSNETEWGLAFGSRYRYRPTFEPGFEIHSEFGEIGDSPDFDDQKHLVGPTAYGQFGHFKYDVGTLFGITDASPDATLKAILEYEVYF